MRYDYVELPFADGEMILNKLRSEYVGTSLHVPALGEAVCDEFEYVDPVDDSVSSAQGIRMTAKDDSFRMIYRLSGTGSSGSTVRVYCERVLRDWQPMPLEEEQRLILEVMHVAIKIARIAEFTGRDKPSLLL
jgi:phosphoglucomutase